MAGSACRFNSGKWVLAGGLRPSTVVLYLDPMSKLKRLLSKPENPRPPRQRSLARIGARTFVLAAALILSAVGPVYWLLESSMGPAQQEYRQKLFSAVVGQVQQWLARRVEHVDSLARDVQVVQLINASDQRARQLRQGELAVALGAKQVMLLPVGTESQYLGEYPGLNYAELDLLLRAKSEQLPDVEFHPERSGGHFDVVRPIVGNGHVAGTLLVRFDQSILSEFMDRATTLVAGTWTLKQLLPDDKAVTIGHWGTLPAGERHVLTADIEGAGWQIILSTDNRDLPVLVRYWPILYWCVAAAVLVGLAGALALQRRWLRRALEHDSELLCAVARDRLGGQWMGKDYLPRLVEFQSPLNRLQAMHWSVLGGNGGRQDSDDDSDEPARNPGTAGDDDTLGFEASFPSIFFQGEDAIVLDDTAQNDAVQTPAPSVSASIFRAYDIRGVVDDTLTPDVVYEIGRAVGSEAWVNGEQAVVVGRDGRLSGPKLTEALIGGLRASGRDVIDVGRVPTPVLYFATQYLSTRSGVMVTGSHNPPQYNGLKIVIKGETLAESAIQRLRRRVMDRDFMMGEGSLSSQDLTADYIARVCADVRPVRPLRVVVDCGNGVAGGVAPDLIRSLGCDLIELYCDVDGRFPNHHPDPSQPENLVDLIDAVKREKADVGLAFDGDGDRLGVVDSHGHVIWPDRQMMLYAADVLKSNRGAQVIYDVKCTRHLKQVIEDNGGAATMWKTGHSLMKKKLKDTGALLAGEMSGHIFFNDRWFGFDDALYTAARLLEILSKRSQSSYEIFKALPNALATPELRVDMAEGEHHAMIERLKVEARFPGAQLVTIDGVRAEFDFGWGLVRASNTTPSLILRFEADHEKGLAQIQRLFRDILLGLDPGLKLSF